MDGEVPRAGVAGLPMYDLIEVREATDAWWHALALRLRAHGIADAPDELERAGDFEATWTSPNLVLAQTCGYPLTHALAGRVRVVATPRYRAPGCKGPSYASM